MKKAFCFVMLCAGVLLLSSCKREISITYEQPLEQKDYRLFFLGLSTDITEMPTNGKLCGEILDDIDDKILNFLLFYQGDLVYHGTIYLDNINDRFNLHFVLHPSQFDTTAVLEITYKNKNSPHLNCHEYAVLNLNEGCENPPESSWALAAVEQIKESMN